MTEPTEHTVIVGDNGTILGVNHPEGCTAETCLYQDLDASSLEAGLYRIVGEDTYERVTEDPESAPTGGEPYSIVDPDVDYSPPSGAYPGEVEVPLSDGEDDDAPAPVKKAAAKKTTKKAAKQ